MKPLAPLRFSCGLIAASLLAACSSLGPRSDATSSRIAGELKATEPAAVRPAAVDQALLPPLQVQAARPQPTEQRFDLVLNNAAASQVFNAIVSGTRYSMLVHPDVSGTLTLNLKDVTVREAMDAIREIYGYEYKVDGTRIYVQPVTLQARVYQVNYLTAKRQGRTDTRVLTGSITTNAVPTTGGTGTGSVPSTPTPSPTGATNNSSEGSQVSTSNTSDFWSELETTVQAIVGNEGGRRVVISPQSGVIVVRAMPKELREVEAFLKTSQAVLERQVMLEAKIVEVELGDGYQQGINWQALSGDGNHRLSAGANTSNIVIPAPGSNAFLSSLSGALPTPFLGLSSIVPLSDLNGAVGLAFTTKNFQAVLSFLDTQGAVQVLSSPRIATINNQKAVLKVGTDDFFVTGITTNTTTTGTSTVSSPTITVQPFFSGISLDVTPQIDEQGHIILHMRPSVSVVTEKDKVINLGTLGGSQNVVTLPLASSRTNQTDSVVRVEDGYIVAIGGLMEQQQSSDEAKVPGIGSIPILGAFFGQARKALHKRELVVLIKPTVIHGESQWSGELGEVSQRLREFETPHAKQ